MGANSPNLWPIMFFDEDRDVLAAIVNRQGVAEHVGMIIDRRDHVLMTFFVPASFCLSTFLKVIVERTFFGYVA